MDQKQGGIAAAIGPIGLLGIIAIVVGGLTRNQGKLSIVSDYIASFFSMLFQTILCLALGAGVLYLLVFLGAKLWRLYWRANELETLQQNQINTLSRQVRSYDDHASKFSRLVDELNYKFSATLDEFENFKKTFHGNWNEAAGNILRDAAKDPKVIATLKDSLFPKIKAPDSKMKMEANDADSERPTVDQHL